MEFYPVHFWVRSGPVHLETTYRVDEDTLNDKSTMDEMLWLVTNNLLGVEDCRQETATRYGYEVLKGGPMNAAEAKTIFGMWSAEMWRQKKAGAANPGKAAWEALAKEMNWAGGVEALRKEYYHWHFTAYPRKSARVEITPSGLPSLIDREHPISTLGLTKTVAEIAAKATDRVATATKETLRKRTTGHGETVVFVYNSAEEVEAVCKAFPNIAQSLKWTGRKAYVLEPIHLSAFNDGRKVFLLAITRM